MVKNHKKLATEDVSMLAFVTQTDSLAQEVPTDCQPPIIPLTRFRGQTYRYLHVPKGALETDG